MLVLKRNGDQVPFDLQKIELAITKAYWDGDWSPKKERPPYAKIIAEYIANLKKDLSVEEIQDFVETELMKYDRITAKNYIRYRHKREVARNCKTDFMEAIGEKLSAANVQNQNANVDEHSFGGRVGEASSLMTRQYALDYILSPMARRNHLENMIYEHDLDAYAVGSHNCLTIPFDKLLSRGFNTRQADIRPANSGSTAFQLLAVIFQLQSLQQFGGVSASHLDWTMVPYVRKSFAKHFLEAMEWLYEKPMSIRAQFEEYDLGKVSIDFKSDSNLFNIFYKENPKAYNYAMKMTEKELNQAVEAMYHNLSIWAA